MTPVRSIGGPRGRAALPLAVLVALLAVVAAASSGGRQRVAIPDRAAAWIGDYAFTLLVTTAAVAIVVSALMLILYARLPRKWDEPPDRAPVLAFFLLLGSAVVLATTVRDREQPPFVETGPPAARGSLPVPEKRVARSEPPVFRWEVPAALAGLAGIAVGAYAVRRRPADVLPPPVHEEVAGVLEETLDDLRAEQDFRRAVVAAYARLEQVLARHGTPRREAEAPFEYLARVLAELRVSEAATRRLTELFERAKFSTHVIDARMKDDAIDAVVSVRDELRAAA